MKGIEMVSNELGKRLHDRATCGGSLSAEERKQLETWYADQDRAEMEALDLTTTDTVATLQTQVDSVLAQLGTAAKRIQEISEENEKLRKEISTLHHKLAQQAVTRPA
jgi:peptidoglycan hydrolase CwlO-like protein